MNAKAVQACDLVREIATPRLHEKREVYIQRAADTLGISYRQAYGLYYQQKWVCSPDLVERVLAQREVLLLQKVAQNNEAARLLVAETERLWRELRALRGDRCGNTYEYTRPSLPSTPPSSRIVSTTGSTGSPDGSWEDNSLLQAFALGNAL